MKPIFLAMIFCGALCAFAGDDLEESFRSPPDSARPQVIWFWMNGNVTSNGITADLEAMKRIGIGGAQIYSVPVGIASGLVKHVSYFSDEWRALEEHATKECARLGLQLSVLCGDGWVGGGGPWITPDNTMQRVTWSETIASGPSQFSGSLPQPETKEDFYRDIAVFAVPVQAKLPAPKITTKGKNTLVTYERPVVARSLSLTIALAKKDNPVMPQCELQISDDGKTFRPIGTFLTGWEGKAIANFPSTEFSFDAVTSRFFQVVQSGPGKLNVELGAEPRVNFWQIKTGDGHIRDHGAYASFFAETNRTAQNWQEAGIASDQVINLTDKLTADGKLSWAIPAGNWTILRIGYTPTGQRNAPAMESGRGLECDKMNAAGVEKHFDAMMGKLVKQVGPLAGKSLANAVIDSWEMGPQNWTPELQKEFKKRRGYDMTPWLPVMAGGRVIGTREESERFLWDLRRTLADLIAENFYGHLAEISHAHGIGFQSEACGRQQFLYDPIVYQKKTDFPMGEFWYRATVHIDCRTAASAAHLYGKPVVSAESYTSGHGNWNMYPYSMKMLGDLAFCNGVNRYVFHRYAMQPWVNLKPGMTMGSIGINLDRTQTWWEPGAAWMKYIARCQQMLREGQFVADVVCLTGEGAPSKLDWREDLHPALPASFDYDGCDADALSHLLTVKDGRLVTPSGMSYRVLLLPDSVEMTPTLARRIRELVNDGATIIGPRPARSPSLTDYPHSDDEVQNIAKEVWGDCDGKAVKSHSSGKGRVFWGQSFGEIASATGLKPDFEFHPGNSEIKLAWIHRRASDADFYFLSNQSDSNGNALCTFRVNGKQPELWDAATGQIRKPARFEEKDGRTTVQIPFDPRGSWFVVFRKPASKLAMKPDSSSPANLWIENGKLIEQKETDTLSLDADWNVNFPPNLGAPASVHLEKLADLSLHSNEGVRHFSGTATYRKKFVLNHEPSAINHFFLNLGNVQVIAEIIVNGQNLGVLWKQPFRANISSALKSGDNELEIRVTNLWINRLIGDAAKMRTAGFMYTAGGQLKKWPDWISQDAPPADAPATFATWQHWHANDKLSPSGLLGPVTLQTTEKRTIGP